MAGNPFDQFDKPAGKPAGNPFDQFDKGYKKPAGDGQMVSGFKRSFEEVPGMLAGVGAFGADLVGATETRDALLGYAKRKQEEVGAAHAGDAQSITDTWDGKTGWLDFLANASGYVAGQALQSIATGGLGAFGAKMLASKGAKEVAEAAAAKAIAGGATEAAAQAAAAEALAAATTKAMTRGAAAGAGAQNMNMELGSIYPDAVEEAGGADNLDGGDKFRVFAAASLAAGVDTLGEAINASRVLKGSKAGQAIGADGMVKPGPGMLGRAAREVPAGMAREAGTEGVQTVLEQYGAAKTIGDAESIKDIVDSMGVGAVGGGLAGGIAARKARESDPVVPPAAAPGADPLAPEAVAAVLGASTLDDAIKAAANATTTALTRPRAEVSPLAAEIRALDDPQDRQEALGLVATAENPNASGAVRRFAQNRLDELLLQVRQIPVGEATELTPDLVNADVALMKYRSPAQIAADGTAEIKAAGSALQDRRDAAAIAQPLPVGEATDLTPEQIELGQIPVGEAIEVGGPRPDGMSERRNTDGSPIDPTGPNAAAAYIERMRATNTPAARAFVQEFNAGRITREDVMGLLGANPTKATPTADERLAAAAGQKQQILPTDLLTGDGMPYGSKTAAGIRAKKEAGTVVPVEGGWVVRKETAGVQPDVPVPADVAVPAADAAGDQPGGSVPAVRPVADAGTAGDVQAGMPAAAGRGEADQPAAGPGSELDGALSNVVDLAGERQIRDTASFIAKTERDEVLFNLKEIRTYRQTGSLSDAEAQKAIDALRGIVEGGDFDDGMEIVDPILSAAGAKHVQRLDGAANDQAPAAAPGGSADQPAAGSGSELDGALKTPVGAGTFDQRKTFLDTLSDDALRNLVKKLGQPTYSKGVEPRTARSLYEGFALSFPMDRLQAVAGVAPAAAGSLPDKIKARKIKAADPAPKAGASLRSVVPAIEPESVAPIERDWTAVPPAEIEAELDRLDNEHRALNKRQLATPGIDSPERMALLRQMDAIDSDRRKLVRLLPDEDAAQADEAEEAKFGEPGYEAPENWRTSLYQARQYLKDMGVAFNDMPGELAAVLKLIDARLKPSLPEKVKAKKEGAAATPVNGQEPAADLPAKNRLLLMPCSEGKLKEASRAADMYQGVMWQSLRTHLKAGHVPQMAILSAEHGFISPDKNIDPYENRMTRERAGELVKSLAAEVDSIKKALKPGAAIKDVMIVGGADYREVMRAAVSALIADGTIEQGASVNETTGGIGEQRQQLGQYLDKIGPAEDPKAKIKAALPATKKLQAMLDSTRRYASGMSRIGDFGNGALAAGSLQTRGIGVDVGELSANGIKLMAHAVNAWQTAVFVDSGAFSAFRKGLKSGQFTPMDFEAVLKKYDDILDAIGTMNEEESFDETYPRPLMVMPDVPGDQAASLALTEKFAKWISFEAKYPRMRPIVALHAGDLSLSEAYRQTVAALGTDNFIVGIPAVENAISSADLTAFLKESKPAAVHILGAAHDKTLTPRLQAILDADLGDAIEVTADASKVRNAIVRAVAKGAQRGDAIAEAIFNEDDPANFTPAERAEKAEAEAEAANKPPEPNPARNQVVIELRKRLSVLNALRACLG